jgi:hypothetical protein
VVTTENHATAPSYELDSIQQDENLTANGNHRNGKPAATESRPQRKAGRDGKPAGMESRPQWKVGRKQ